MNPLLSHNDDPDETDTRRPLLQRDDDDDDNNNDDEGEEMNKENDDDDDDDDANADEDGTKRRHDDAEEQDDDGIDADVPPAVAAAAAAAAVAAAAGREEDNDDDDDDNDNDENNGNDADNNADDDADNNNIDGGVAVGLPGGHSSSCALVLLIESGETLPFSIVPNPTTHPIYRKGVTVSIGHEKNTKLSAVFNRYCQFANSYTIPNPPTNTSTTPQNTPQPTVNSSDLDFYHASLLRPIETAESNALMKNDRVTARHTRQIERMRMVEATAMQRESDREYHHQMRYLLPDTTNSIAKCDVAFKCVGNTVDENRFKQGVLSPYVRAHSRLLGKRCPWLGKLIDTARREKDEVERVKKEVERVNKEVERVEEKDKIDGVAVIEGGNMMRGAQHSFISESPEEDEDDDGILPAPVQPNQNQEHAENDVGGGDQPQQPQANAVEDDEDDEDDESLNNLMSNISSSSITNAVPIDTTNEIIRSESPVHSRTNKTTPTTNTNRINTTNNSDTLTIPISHPPEAVKLLLEYCYTNRVIPLGNEAFLKSYRKPDINTVDTLLRDHVGPVEPYSTTNGQGSRSSWPDNGKPTVTLSEALAGIRLAEEAELPRLSLMCEVAASQLVKPATLLESLALCEELKRGKRGNELGILRKAVMMHHVLAYGSRGVGDLAKNPSFQRGLHERSDVVLPSLLVGVAEAIKIGAKGGGARRSWKLKKADLVEERKKIIELKKLDDNDALDRARERAYWRKDRWNKRVKISTHNDTDGIRDPYDLESEPTEETVPHTIILNDDLETVDPRATSSNHIGSGKAKGKRSFRSHSHLSTMFGGNTAHRHLVAADRGYGYREVRSSGASSSIATATTSGAVTKNSSSRSRKRGR